MSNTKVVTSAAPVKPNVGFGTSTKTAGPGQITSKEVALLTSVINRAVN